MSGGRWVVLKSGERISSVGHRAAEGRIKLVLETGAEREEALEDVDLLASFLANGGERRPEPGQDALLELLAARREERGRYAAIEGLVRNGSASALPAIVAAVRGFDAAGRFLGGEEALVDLRPLAPGDRGRFRVVWCPEGRIERSELSFRALDGTALPHREAPGAWGEAALQP
jgi:hypothetical protein